MNLSLEGKNAVVCGGSQGIGFAIAEELAIMGANCILVARNKTKLEIAVQQLDVTIRQSHSIITADFSNNEEVRRFITDLVAKRPIHILINNTGGPPPGGIVEANEMDFIKAFNQHVINNQILVKAVLPSMKSARFGRIINIISTSVKIPLKNLGVSNTIRGAVASWAKTLSNEVAQYNITVNNVLPGFAETERLKSLIKTNAQKANTEEKNVVSQMVAEIPARRFGSASEIAAMAAFLASPAASYVNGTSIPVDGGRTGSI
jgi:Dehydrogenases with different specificities (related to short-chain alcohol dehydrogenases)